MRNSDRWVTPGVLVAALVVAGVVVLGIGAGLVYLAAIGRDPDPVLRLVAQVVTATGSLGTLCLQLANRSTVAKTERNTGVLAGQVQQLAADSGRHHEPVTVAAPAARTPPPPLPR